MVRARALFTALLGLVIGLVVLAAPAAAQPPTTTPTPPPTSTPSSPTPATTSPNSSSPTTQSEAPTSSTAEDTEGCTGTEILGVCTPFRTPTQMAKDQVTDAARAFGSDLVDYVLSGWTWVTKYVIQLFMSVSVDATGTQDAVQRMTDLTSDLQVIGLGLGLLIAVIAVLYQRAMLSGDNAAPEAFAGLVRWGIAATMAAPTLLALSQVSDALATWIFTSAAGPDGPTQVVDKLTDALAGRDERLKVEDVIAFALCVLGLLAYIELMIQLVLQKFWIIYAAFALPIAGATSVVSSGKTVFFALLRVAVAALLFKPIAAACFGVAFMQIRSLESGGDVLWAVMLLVAPAFVLPILVQMIGTNVSYAGTPMLRGTIRNTRAGLSAAGSALGTAGRGAAGAAGMAGRGAAATAGAAGAGAAAVGRGAAKAVPFVGAMGSAAVQTITGPPRTRATASSATASGGAAAAGAVASRAAASTRANGASGGTGTATTAASAAGGNGSSGTSTAASSPATVGARGSSTANRAGATTGSGTSSNSGGADAPAVAGVGAGARTSTRSAATSGAASGRSTANTTTSSTSTGSGGSEGRGADVLPMRRSGARGRARTGTPRDSTFTRIT
ncbi:hypothetical protein [Nocardia farcinica]|uniref:hypothetical protein n=2 Tax=Nocardia farcinica TaxID=37329 RepID=UPI001E561BFD|nr:hypothetical protein [Nocardia farcinica]MCZ9330280.1 hypothetical protein [Nocardia farcinica]UEX26202.1 hypothetical protein LMJ57_30085 [Nocardia farcinica]